MGSILEAMEKNPKEMKRLLGIDQEQFRQLIAQVKLIHNQKQDEIERNKLRVNKKGGGKKPKLSQKEQILLTLVYLRHSPTFQLLGLQFGVSETTANDIFHYWLPIISEALPPTLLEQVKKFEGDYEWIQELLSEVQLIVDTSEQARQRPLGYQEQKEFYSGKKKNHTSKESIYCPTRRKRYCRYSPRSTRHQKRHKLVERALSTIFPKAKICWRQSLSGGTAGDNSTQET